MSLTSNQCCYEKLIPFGIPYYIFYPVFLNALFLIYVTVLVPFFKDGNSLINQFSNVELLSFLFG